MSFNLDFVLGAGKKALTSQSSIQKLKSLDFEFLTNLDAADKLAVSLAMKLQDSIKGAKKAPLWMPKASTKATTLKVVALRENGDYPHGEAGISANGNGTILINVSLACVKTGIRSSLLATLPEDHSLTNVEEGSIISVGAIRLKEGDQFFTVGGTAEEPVFHLNECRNDFLFIPNGIEGSIVTETAVTATPVAETVGRD